MATLNQLNAAGPVSMGQRTLETAGMLQGLRQNEQVMQRQTQQDQAEQQAQQQQQQVRQEGAELLKGDDTVAIAEWMFNNPAMRKDFIDTVEFKDEGAKNSRIDYAKNILSGNVIPKEALTQRIIDIEMNGGNASGLKQTLALGNDEAIKAAALKDLAVMDTEAHKYYMESQGGVGTNQVSRDVETHQYLIGVINDPKSKPHEVSAARIALKLDPAAAQTIQYKQELSDMGVKSSGIKNLKKLEQSYKWKPIIEAAVIEAKKIAQEKGNVFTDLNQLETSLPFLNEAVDKLRELAPLATSTWGGELWGGAVKQLGFGSTKGKTAQEGFTAIVNNQILPLLKPTFGGAMTEGEGKRLAASMGDATASPDVKMAQLTAFIEQKARTIRAKKEELKGLSKGGGLSEAEQAELQQLRAELGQ